MSYIALSAFPVSINPCKVCGLLNDCHILTKTKGGISIKHCIDNVAIFIPCNVDAFDGFAV